MKDSHRATSDQQWFRQIYLPDLPRKDHTSFELRYLVATDPNVTRFIRIELLALCREYPGMIVSGLAPLQTSPLRGRIEIFAEENGIVVSEALWRRVERIRQAYRRGGLWAVLRKWSARLSDSDKARFGGAV